MIIIIAMHNPPHPGEFIKATYIDPYHLRVRTVAKHLNVAPSTLNRLLKGRNAISPEIACRLSIVLGRSPESWLAMQTQYDLWQTQKKS